MFRYLWLRKYTSNNAVQVNPGEWRVKSDEKWKKEQKKTVHVSCAQPATIAVHRQSSSQVNINFYQTFSTSKMDGSVIIQPIPNQWTITEISLHSHIRSISVV